MLLMELTILTLAGISLFIPVKQRFLNYIKHTFRGTEQSSKRYMKNNIGNKRKSQKMLIKSRKCRIDSVIGIDLLYGCDKKLLLKNNINKYKCLHYQVEWME